MLVPEIALTPQTVGRFQARFGDTVALLHSALGEGERYDEWRRLRSGEARIAVGPRSAVFAPVRDLGLIVIDEEHDPSYKHEGDPRYDARPVAARRVSPGAQAEAALRSKPKLDTVSRAPSTGLDLPRATSSPTGRTPSTGAPVPGSSRAAPRRARRPGTRCRTSRCRARRTAARCRRCGSWTCAARATRCTRTRGARSAEARKAILLLNRRGWSNFLTCRACGKVWECPQCDVALVLHRAERRRRLPPLRPPRAGARALRRVRIAVGRPLRRGHGAARGRAGRGARRARVPARRRHRGRQGRRAGAARALRGGAGRAARRDADGRQGPRLPRRHARRRRRRRLDAALPGLPRRGADVRADRPARRPRRARAARRPRARPDDRARRARDRRGRRATTRAGSSPASSRGGARSTTRRSPT